MKSILGFLAIALSVFVVPNRTMAIEFERIPIRVPRTITHLLSRSHLSRSVKWAGTERIIFSDYYRDTLRLIDITTGDIIDEYQTSMFETIRGIDRRAGLVELRGRDTLRYISFEPEANDSPPYLCPLEYEYAGQPGGPWNFRFVRVAPDGTTYGPWQSEREAFPVRHWNSAGGLRVVACSENEDTVIAVDSTASRLSTGAIFLVRLDGLIMQSIEYLGLYGSDAVFYDDRSIVTLQRNEEVIEGENEPSIYYPVLVSINDGEVIAEDRSIRIVEASNSFDYDPVTRRIIALVEATDGGGEFPFPSEIAVYQIVD